MGGVPYTVGMPEIVAVHLENELGDWTFAVELDLPPRERDTLLSGGELAEIKRGEEVESLRCRTTRRR